MKKTVLTSAVKEAKSETASAIIIILDALNQGQRKKVVKNAAVKALLDRYGIDD